MAGIILAAAADCRGHIVTISVYTLTLPPSVCSLRCLPLLAIGKTSGIGNIQLESSGILLVLVSSGIYKEHHPNMSIPLHPGIGIWVSIEH